MKIKIILLSSLFIFINCDIGQDNGKDLSGTWIQVYYDLNFHSYNGKKYYFKNDNTGNAYFGYQNILGQTALNHTYPDDFKWFVDNNFPYKTLNITDTQNIGKETILKKDIKYIYYFSIDKNYLYMKEKGTNDWNTWKKY